MKNRILADARHEWDVNPGRYFDNCEPDFEK